MGKDSKVTFSKVQSIFFFGLIALLSAAMLYLVSPFIYPVFWAAVIAIIFYPMHRWLKNHLGLRNISAFLSVLIIVAIVFLPLTLVSILLANQTINLYLIISENDIAGEIGKIIQLLNNTPLSPYLDQLQQKWAQSATEIAQNISLGLISSIRQVTSSSVRFLGQFFIMLYTLFYFFKDGPKILGRMMHLSPLGDKYEKKLFDKFTSTASATLKSTLIIGGIQGSLGGILFWAAGIPGAMIWAVIMIILAVIPVLGAPILIVPAGLVMLALGNMWEGVLLIAGGGGVAVVDNFLRPLLVGKDIHMHPLLVLFSTLGGIVLFGVSGFIIGPIIASLFLAIVSIYDFYYQKELNHN